MGIQEGLLKEVSYTETPKPEKSEPAPPLPPGDKNNDEFGGDGEGNIEDRRNAFIAVSLFLGADVMLFAGLIGAFIIYKFGAEIWPPPDQPRLPLDITTINTLVLLLSGVFMTRVMILIKKNKAHLAKKFLWLTLFLGATFLTIQGAEWLRLISYGITLKSGVFGGTFYLLIGCHAVHFFAAVLWLGIAAIKFKPTQFSQNRLIVELSGLYWLLVVLLWPVLFICVYL